MRFDPKINIGHCDLFSLFSDFALHLKDNVIYEHTNSGL